MQDHDGEAGGGSSPPGRRGAKPCRVCEEQHWEAFEKYPGSGVWYGRVWHRGKQVVKKVGTHGQALRAAAKWKVEIAEGRFFPNAVAVADELLSDAIKAYRDRRGEGLGGDGSRILQRWEESAEVKGKTVRDFTVEDAEKFLKRRAAGGRYSASTRNHDVSYLFTFFEDYEDRRRRDRKRAPQPAIANPVRGLRVSEKDHERTRYLSEAEEKRLFAALPTDLDRAVVHIGIQAGLREANIFGLDWDRDIRLPSRKLRGWSRKGRPQGRMRNKPLRERWVPINDELLGVLRALPSYPASPRLVDGERRWLFPNATGSGPLDPKNWYHRVWRPALAAAGIQNFHFHDLRHTTGTRLGMKGVRTRDIATALGHADERMAQRYEHAADADGHMLAVMQKLARKGATTPATAPEGPEAPSPETSRQASATEASGNAA